MDEIETTGSWLLAGYELLQSAQSISTEQLPDNDVDKRQFRRLLRQTHKTTMRNWIINFYLPWLRARGIPASSPPEELEEALEFALTHTDDLYDTVITSLTAAFPLDQWRSVQHQALILRDLARRASDRLEVAITRRLQRDPGLTGNKRWRTTHPDSRHATLDGRQSRETWAYKGTRITGPRHNPGNPSEWSGCACYVEYEWRDNEGSLGWV